MLNQKPVQLSWVDLLWVVLLGVLAVLPPILEIHKDLILLAIGATQLFEQQIFSRIQPARARVYSVLIKTLLATLLLGHTGGIPINSSYYLIFYLPVVSAAMIYDIWRTLLWTLLASAAYCSYLIPALQVYELTASGATELAIRILFFFLAAIVVNRFVEETRHQSRRYQLLAEAQAETNRRLEQAQAEMRRSERLAALGQLSAGLAHEIRNPLGVIKGSAEMLSQRIAKSDPLVSELAGYISSEVNRLNALVNRFLDFARPLQPEFSSEKVPPLLDQSLRVTKERWPDSKVELEKYYAPDLPTLSLDAGLCEQVFTNLLFNAYEAMPNGGKLKVTALRANSDGQEAIAIEIEDTGPGIPREIQDQIFNPFFTTKKGGVGLGLSIVSKIIDNHNGEIQVQSTLGKGTCFRILFPVGDSLKQKETPEGT
jgi:two-component system sensor histidine kinase HydH